MKAKAKTLVLTKSMTFDERYARIEALELRIKQTTLEPKKPKKPCECGDELCYGFVRYSGGVREGRSLPKHMLKVDDAGDLLKADTYDIEVQHIVPCVVIGCGKYTMHVRTLSGVLAIFERIPGDPRMWAGGQGGWMFSYSSADQLGLYRAFIPSKKETLTASALWYGQNAARPA